MLKFYCFVIVLLQLNIQFTQCEKSKKDLVASEKNLFEDLRQRLTNLESAIESRKCSRNGTTNTPNTSTTGTTYVRWGVSTCPSKSSTKLVYSGIVGGSHYSHSGAAVNYLCLPKNSEWGLYMDGYQGANGYIYGAEYEFYDNAFTHRFFTNHEVPCAVCETIGRTKHLMIAAKNSCEAGWTMEYRGYLMTGYHGHKAAAEYICVDKKPEKIGTASSEDGILLYMVEARCGSLPCPPYVEGREIVCAVCTK